MHAGDGVRRFRVGCQRDKEEYVTVRQMAKHVLRFFASRPSLDPETKENTIISGKVSGLFNRRKLKRFHARQWLNTGRWGPCLRNLGMGRNLSFIPPPSRAPARCSRDEPDGNRMDFLHGGLSMPGERRPGPAYGVCRVIQISLSTTKGYHKKCNWCYIILL